MIDGCFLVCLGRILKNFIDEERIIHIDVLPLHQKYGDVFLYTDVPEAERTEVAREVADKLLTMLKEEGVGYAPKATDTKEETESTEKEGCCS